MALSLDDRVLVTTTTTGTGTYALGAAVSAAWRDFAGIANGARVSYAVVDSLTAPTAFEVCEGIFSNTGSPFTLTRALIHRSSNAGVAVNWPAGTRYILLTPPAARLLLLDENNQLDMGARKITNLGAPTAANDAARKDMGGATLNNLGAPAAANDAARKDMGGATLNNLGAPAVGSDAATKTYADTKAPLAQTGAGPGQVVTIAPATGAAAVLPATGTWKYSITLYNGGLATSFTASIAGGGSTIGGANPGQNWLGSAERVT